MGLFHRAPPPAAGSRRPAGFMFSAVILVPLSFLSPGCRQRLPVPGPPSCYGDFESSKLERLTRRYLELAWALDPQLALAACLEEGPATGSHQEWLERVRAAPREVRHLRAELRRVKERGLNRREGEDLSILAGYLAALEADLEVRRPWRDDPGLYLDRIEADLEGARRSGNQTARCEAFRRGLAEVPALLAAAEGSVHHPSPLLLRAAALRAERLARRLERRECCPRAFQCGLREAIGEAAEAAARALRGHARRLRGREGPTRAGGWALGGARLGRILRCGAGLDTPPANLLARLEEERGRLRRACGEGGAAAGAVHRELSGPPSKASLAAARAWSLRAGLLPQGLFPPRAQEEGGWTGAAVAALDPAECLTLAREGYPGRAALREALCRALGDSLVRRGHPCRLLLQGWCSYAEDLFAAGVGRAGVAARRCRNRLGECTRACLALALHLGRLTLAEAAAELEGELGLPPAEALVTAAALARRPRAALGWVGARAIHRLRGRVAAAKGRAFLPALFHRRLLLAGPVPLPRLEEALFG